MDEALKRKVMIGVFAALVGLVVFLNWPKGEPDYTGVIDDWEPAARVKKAQAPEVDTVERRQREAEEEEEDGTTRRRKKAEIDEPIRRGSKKPTAKKQLAPAA